MTDFDVIRGALCLGWAIDRKQGAEWHEAKAALSRVETELAEAKRKVSCDYDTGQGQNCGKCNDCLQVNYFFTKDALDHQKARADAAEAERDEQRARAEAAEAERDRNHRMLVGTRELLGAAEHAISERDSWRREAHALSELKLQAQQERDEARKALDEIAAMPCARGCHRRADGKFCQGCIARAALADKEGEVSAHDVLTPETVKQLRDAGPKDLLWLICDSHELLRAERDALIAAAKVIEIKGLSPESARLYFDQRNEQADEVARLREALREIADTPWSSIISPETFVAIARAALADKEGEA